MGKITRPATLAVLAVFIALVATHTAGVAVAAGPVVGPGTTFNASADGPTVTITEELELDDPFYYPDGHTVDLSPHATFESDGATNVTVDEITGQWTNLTTHDVAAGLEIDPGDKQAVTVKGTNVNALNVSAVDTTAESTDIAYDTGSAAELTVTDLPADTTIEAVDIDSDVQLDQQTTDGSGTATFSLDGGARGITFVEATDEFTVDITGTNSPVTEGERLTVDVSVENVGTTDGEQTVELFDFDETSVDDESISLGADDDTDLTLEWLTETAGEGTVTVSAAGTDDTAAVEIDAESTPPPPGPGDDDEDDESEDGEADDEPTDSEQTIAIEESVDEQTGDRILRTTITNTTAGSVVRLDTTSTPTGEPIASLSNSSLDSISMSMGNSRERTSLNITSYEPDVTGRVSETSVNDTATVTSSIGQTARDFEETTGSVAAGYVAVQHDLEDADLDNVTLEYTVEKSYLSDLGTTAEAVSLVHKSDGTEQSELPTEQVGENESHYRFESEAPSFSVFAIDTGAETLVVGNATLDRDTVEPGESATVSTSVRNRGTVAAEQELTLTVDGETTETQTVAVAGGSAETVELQFEPEGTGEYELAINDRFVGSVNVEGGSTDDTADQSDDEQPDDTDEQGDQTATDTDGEDDSEESADGFGPGFGIGATLAGAVILTLSAYWQRKRRYSK